jgi:hypothetical protein
MRCSVAIVLPMVISAILILGILTQQSLALSPNLQAAYNRGYKIGHSWGVYDKQHSLKFYAHNPYHGGSCRALLPNCYYQQGFNAGYYRGFVDTSRPRY